MAGKASTQKPGQPAKDSGQYKQQDKKGNLSSTEIAAIKGKPLPPTKKSGNVWVEVDETKHKNKK
jgi:hypothetical protein